MKNMIVGLFSVLSLMSVFNQPVYAEAEARVVVTVLYASTEGADFNLDNDAYRDKLIALFSYSYYEQRDQQLVRLEGAGERLVQLPGNYQLTLRLKEASEKGVTLEGIIRKEGVTYLDTALMIAKPGVVFVGGPPLGEGVLILALETGV